MMMYSQRVINTNLSALNALDRFRSNAARLEASSQRMSSGKKVQRSADDVSAYSIIQTFNSQNIRSEKVLQNIQDGNSLLDTADGTLTSITDGLQRARELLIGMASDVNGPQNRVSIAKELRAIFEEVDRQAQTSNFNGIKLLDGSVITNARVQIGVNSNTASNTLDLASALKSNRITDLSLINGTASGSFLPNLDAVYDNTTETTQLNSSTRIYQYLQDFDKAIAQVTSQRATIGSFQSRLELASNTLQNQMLNTTQAQSRLEDADIAAESAEFTQAQILQKAAVSILSQSNSNGQDVLELLRQ